MDMMVVPKPIFRPSKEVAAYYLSFQIGNALIEEGKSYTLDLMSNLSLFDFIDDLGLDVITMGKELFVPASDILLAADIKSHCKVDCSQIVLMLNKRTMLTQDNLDRVIRHRQDGFKIAFFNYTTIEAINSFLPHIDYLFCHNDTDVLMPAIRYLKSNSLTTKVIATKVDQAQTFDRVSLFGLNYFAGSFYKVPVKSRTNTVTPLQVNYLQLLNQVNNDDFEFESFTKTIQRDTALTIQFLKMVNSSHVRSNKITSLRHAAALIGQIEIKRWITTAVASSLSQEKPGEITRLSLLRAKFCESISGLFEMAVHSENLFLMGMFSVLDVILDMSIEQALDLVFVPEPVKIALTGGSNDFTMIYEFMKEYEHGDWTEISRTALMRGMDIKDIYDAYYETLAWYGRLINMSVDEDEINDDE